MEEAARSRRRVHGFDEEFEGGRDQEVVLA
jgi:hypothetical protein